MVAKKLRQAQQRAAIQTKERNVRYEARSRSKETLSQSDLEVIRSPNSMEEHQCGKIIDSIPIFSGQSNENIKDWLEIVFKIWYYWLWFSTKTTIYPTIPDWECFEMASHTSWWSLILGWLYYGNYKCFSLACYHITWHESPTIPKPSTR